MLIEHNFIDLFKKFIKASETGRRIKKNGHRISPNTVKTLFWIMLKDDSLEEFFKRMPLHNRI
jgi:hypothetical protein